MFLTHNIESNLKIMATLRSGTTWVGEQKKTGKLWLLGVNEATLYDVKLSSGKFGSFIECVFVRKPQYIHGLMTKVSFVPHKAYYRRFDELSLLLHGFGKELKGKSETRTNEQYLSWVSKGLRTLIGKDINIVMSLTTQAIKDEYGDAKIIDNGWTKREDLVWRNVIVNYGSVDWKLLYNMFLDLER